MSASHAIAGADRAGGARAEPVFVVGMNGSGTTMLLDCLGRHPELYAFPEETIVIPWLTVSQRRRGDPASDDDWLALWDKVRGLPVFRQQNGGERVPLPPDWRARSRDLATVLDAMFTWFAAREGKRRWCEKTPQHVQHIGRLAALFPRARFIHVIRDGRDCAASFYRRWRRTPELTLYRWKKVVQEGERQGRALPEGSYLQVRYEDLTRSPETGMRAICAFLGVAFDRVVLESAEPYLGRGVKGRPGRLQPNSGAWRERFPAGRVARLEGIGGAALATYGYDVQARGDEDPGMLQRGVWGARDHLVQYGLQLWRRITGRTRRPWRILLTRPLMAVRQFRTNRF